MEKIIILKKLIIAMTTLISLLQQIQNPQLGVIATSVFTIQPILTTPITATSSISILQAMPKVIVQGNVVNFSATGVYDDCSVYIEKIEGFSFSFNQIIQKVYLSGKYPFIFMCAMKGKQVSKIQSTIIIP